MQSHSPLHQSGTAKVLFFHGSGGEGGVLLLIYLLFSFCMELLKVISIYEHHKEYQRHREVPILVIKKQFLGLKYLKLGGKLACPKVLSRHSVSI